MSSTVEKLGLLIAITIIASIIFAGLRGIFVFEDVYSESIVYEEVIAADNESRVDAGTSSPKIFNHSGSFLESDVRHTWGGHR